MLGRLAIVENKVVGRVEETRSFGVDGATRQEQAVVGLRVWRGVAANTGAVTPFEVTGVQIERVWSAVP